MRSLQKYTTPLRFSSLLFSAVFNSIPLFLYLCELGFTLCLAVEKRAPVATYTVTTTITLYTDDVSKDHSEVVSEIWNAVISSTASGYFTQECSATLVSTSTVYVMVETPAPSGDSSSNGNHLKPPSSSILSVISISRFSCFSQFSRFSLFSILSISLALIILSLFLRVLFLYRFSRFYYWSGGWTWSWHSVW